MWILSDGDGEKALWALIGVAITAAGAVVIKIMTTRHQISQDERKDLRDEWKELAGRQQAQLDTFQHRITDLEEERDKCHAENAKLQSRVAVLEFQTSQADQTGQGIQTPTGKNPRRENR